LTLVQSKNKLEPTIHPATSRHARGTLSEEEHTSLTEKVNSVTKEADDLRGKIKELEGQYSSGKITARQHDKLIKQYLLRLFDVNRELLPLKERIQKDAEEKERAKVRQKLEAMASIEKRTTRARRRRRVRMEARRKAQTRRRIK
jgi:chromosome segregation ATPase